MNRDNETEEVQKLKTHIQVLEQSRRAPDRKDCRFGHAQPGRAVRTSGRAFRDECQGDIRERGQDHVQDKASSAGPRLPDP